MGSSGAWADVLASGMTVTSTGQGTVTVMSEAVGVDFGTLDGAPLPPGLQVLLQSFRPGRAHTPSYPGSLAQLYHRHEREQTQQVLGFPLPRLSALLEPGQVELVATAGVAEVVAPGARGGSGPVTVLYLPDEEVLQSSLGGSTGASG